MSFQYNVVHDSSTTSGYTEKRCKVTINYLINDGTVRFFKRSLTTFYIYDVKQDGQNSVGLQVFTNFAVNKNVEYE